MEAFESAWGVIKPGEIWCIVGDSESGNSELLMSMDSSTTALVSSKHHFRNKSNTTDFYYQQRFNSIDAEDAPTVAEYLETFSGTGSVWNKDTVIARLNLTALLDEQLIMLSNGETKRLLLAAALLSHPSTLLLDYPLTGLDASTREYISRLIQEISSSGIHVLVASGPSDIPSAVTDIAVMKAGKIISLVKRTDIDENHYWRTPITEIDSRLLDALLTVHPMPVYNKIVQMNEVTVAYHGRTILDRINWTVKQSEKWALSGPNGAGKSTLLSLVNGDNPQAYANNIILFDRQRGSGESIWDIKKNTGYVSPELFQYFPTDSSCLHVIESGFYDTVGLFRPSDIQKEEICIYWMKLMKIESHARTLFNRVNSSVQRLCLLARALVKCPPLLILDEPTQGLDSAQQQFFTKLIDNICRRSNVTVIYVSHYREHIPRSVTHLLQLEKGRVVINE